VAPFESGTGTVVRFDEHRGYGEVRDAAGEEWFFHCTAIADGSRTIAEGTRVRFEVVPGHGGRWEATALRPA
jgi:CspA family cold shock protein